MLEQRANWSRKGIARGGTLVLTDRRLIFKPNSIDASVGLRASQWPIRSIDRVSVAPRNYNPLSGGLRRRLRVDLTDGTRELFVVGDAEQLTDTITAHLS